MNSILTAYRQLLGILFKSAPVMVIMSFVLAALLGILPPLQTFVNSHIFDDGLAIARGDMMLSSYIPYIVIFILCAILPPLIEDIFIYGYVENHSLLILRTAFREDMLKKIKKMKYAHFENDASVEIMDKAFHRAENSARHLYPMYLIRTVSSFISVIGVLVLFFQIRWWLPVTILVPFILETYFSSKNNYNVYLELEKYWKKEREYTVLGEYLRNRDYARESKLNQSSGYLVQTYQDRLHNRNHEYEAYYFDHLKRTFTSSNLTKIGTLGNAVILLVMFLNGGMSVGIFIALTMQVFNGVYYHLFSSTIIFRFSGMHINSFNFYNKFFDLSEDKQTSQPQTPKDHSIEFRDVWFRYPGTDRDILKGLSFTVSDGEKVSVVGENGEGKSTMIKLLMGLFEPDRGEILLGGVPLLQVPAQKRAGIFAPIFQDFVRYSITLKENIGIGQVEHIQDDEMIKQAAARSKADTVAAELKDGYDTLLGRDFEGGVDLSGGQWQRIAIARAFMGEKPILLLDEPTSQLDPMAESRLYAEFSEMADGKTSIFITHRLASTMITDRILVIHDGRVTEEGDHEALMRLGGLYAQMFEAQKQWYQRDENGGYTVEEA